MIALPLVAVWQGRRLARLAARVQQLEKVVKQVGARTPVPAAPAPGPVTQAAEEPIEAVIVIEAAPAGAALPAISLHKRPWQRPRDSRSGSAAGRWAGRP